MPNRIELLGGAVHREPGFAIVTMPEEEHQTRIRPSHVARAEAFLDRHKLITGTLIPAVVSALITAGTLLYNAGGRSVAIDQRLDRIETELAGVKANIATKGELAELENRVLARMDTRLAAIENRLSNGISDLRGEVTKLRSDTSTEFRAVSSAIRYVASQANQGQRIDDSYLDRVLPKPRFQLGGKNMLHPAPAATCTPGNGRLDCVGATELFAASSGFVARVADSPDGLTIELLLGQGRMIYSGLAAAGAGVGTVLQAGDIVGRSRRRFSVRYEPGAGSVPSEPGSARPKGPSAVTGKVDPSAR